MAINNNVINVCHIVSGDLWAGAEVQAYSVVKGLASSPYINMQVITFNNGILSSKLSNDGIPLTIVDETDNNVFSMIRQIYGILKNKNVDLLHTHGFKENFIGGIASKLCTIKCVVRTHHGKGVLEASAVHNSIELINGKYLTNKLIAVSNELKDFLVRNKFNADKITVIHNCLPTKTINPCEDIALLKKQFDIDRNACIIGTIGRMVPIKGHKYFLEGAKDIINKNDNVIFVIVGDGPLMQEIQNYAHRLGIEKYVRFTGFRDDAINILNLFDIFTLTSLHEGIPITLLEAMYLGKSIIASNVGGIPEVIDNNYNGLLIPPRDSRAFSEACLKFLGSKELQDTLSENAKKDALTNYPLHNMLTQTRQVYWDIL